MNVLAISGSLRAASLNTWLLHSARELAPEGMEITVYRCTDLPFYDGDLDGERKPAAVESLRERVIASDALLFATPEYNYSLSGVLKNAIDWLSRPAFTSPMAGKPAGLFSVSPSPTGGARAQAHLKLILSGTLTPVFPAVEFTVPLAQQKFDAVGRLTDETTERRLTRYLAEFHAWVSDSAESAGAR